MHLSLQIEIDFECPSHDGIRLARLKWRWNLFWISDLQMEFISHEGIGRKIRNGVQRWNLLIIWTLMHGVEGLTTLGVAWDFYFWISIEFYF